MRFFFFFSLSYFPIVKSAFAANQTFCLHPLLSLLLLLLVAPSYLANSHHSATACISSSVPWSSSCAAHYSYRYYAAAVGKTANPAISKSFTPHKSNHRRHHHHGEEEQGRGQGPVPAIRDGQ